jgi:peptidyl-prolyl cis-trans isomerase SurA
VEVVMASSADESNMKSILKMMKRDKPEEENTIALNTEDKQNVIFTKGTFDTGDSKLPPDFEIKKGISKVYAHNEAFHVMDIKAVLPAGIKTLEEAKGNVINDYQAEIETNWLEALHERFKVEVNQDALKVIKAKIGN